jgi:hypothetical protein
MPTRSPRQSRLDLGSRSAYTSKFLAITVSIRDVANIRRNVAKVGSALADPIGVVGRVQHSRISPVTKSDDMTRIPRGTELPPKPQS